MEETGRARSGEGTGARLAPLATEAAAAAARWAARQPSRPGSSGPLRCCATARGTEGTGRPAGAAPRPPRSPSERERPRGECEGDTVGGGARGDVENSPGL